MSSPAITAAETSLITELLPRLDQKSIHHIPIVNHKEKLVGMLNRDQIVATLQGHGENAM